MDARVVEANGARIPKIGLGTWTARGKACTEAVLMAVEAGYRHFDTAAMYANEEAVGAGLKASGLGREDYFVTTKVAPADIDEGDLQRSAEASLKRLGLDRVDLLLIHWPNPRIPLKRSVAALCAARRRGLARHIGVSNFTVALVEEAVALADEPLVANQCEYHVGLDQRRLLAATRAAGLAFTAYTPLGGGAAFDLPAVRRMAARHGRTPAQILLRWLVQQPGVVAIPKSESRERIAENIAVFDFSLDEAEMRELFGLARPDGRLVTTGWAPAWDR